MSRVVCEICDIERVVQREHRDVREKVWCARCCLHTRSRIVARDIDHIAPESAMTYKQQRQLFERERGHA